MTLQDRIAILANLHSEMLGFHKETKIRLVLCEPKVNFD